MEVMAVGAVAGVALQEACTATKKGIPYIIRVFSNSACKKLKETINGIKPVVDEMRELSLESSSEGWLQSIEEFLGKLADGLQLIEECENTSFRKLHNKFRYAKKIARMEKYIGDFINTKILPHMALDVMKLKLANDIKRPTTQIEDVKNMARKIDAHNEETVLFQREIIESSGANVEQNELRLCVPIMPSFLVGLDRSIEELMERVLDANVSLVGITGMSGIGKSTLASAFCHHNQIKEHFKERVIYIRIRKSPKIMDIIEKMWEIMVGRPKPSFKNIEEARDQLQYQIASGRNQPTLVVLDDVCSRSDLQNLLFEGQHYKTIVTTRDRNVLCKGHNACVYQLPVLEEDHALLLFCYYAFGQLTIPDCHDKELVKQVQVGCRGLPLALQVIGSSLRDEPYPVWQIAKNKLSRGEPISSSHEEDLYERLKTTSIDVLEDDVKQCFLDLAAFPQGCTISANVLLDVWVCVREMDWDDAFMVLWEFAARSLLELKRDSWSPWSSHSCAYGLSFSQHDVVRNLALYMVKQDNIAQCNRLCMPRMLENIPSKWSGIDTSKVQIVSIHTGTLDEPQWPQISFPEAAALVLYFAAGRFYIPTFLRTMKKLKVLIIQNFSTLRATLNGLDVFNGLSQLQSLHLERLLFPSLYGYLIFLASLEKLSLSLCEGLGNMNELGGDKIFSFPRLSEINVDHCSDLKELPTGICSSNSLKRLSVTNCHQLAKLPDELGNLSILEELRLCACADLTELPPSISNLQQLEFLDISLCQHLKQFPDGFHKLSSLKKLNMTECYKLRQFSKALGELPSLKHVICDKNSEQQLTYLCKAKSMSNLTVEVVEEEFSLDWL